MWTLKNQITLIIVYWWLKTEDQNKLLTSDSDDESTENLSLLSSEESSRVGVGSETSSTKITIKKVINIVKNYINPNYATNNMQRFRFTTSLENASCDG